MTYTMPTNVTSFPSLLSKTNAMVGNDLLAIMFVIIIFTVAYGYVSYRLQMEKALAVSSWIATITAFFVSIIFETSPQFVVLPILLTVISVMLIWKE